MCNSQLRVISWTYEHGSAIVAMRTASGHRYDAAVSTAQMLILIAIDRLLSARRRRPAAAAALLITDGTSSASFASTPAAAASASSSSTLHSVNAFELATELGGRLAPSTIASALLSLTSDKHPLLEETADASGDLAYAFVSLRLSKAITARLLMVMISKCLPCRNLRFDFESCFELVL